jgi:hypothetical protein
MVIRCRRLHTAHRCVSLYHLEVLDVDPGEAKRCSTIRPGAPARATAQLMYLYYYNYFYIFQLMYILFFFSTPLFLLPLQFLELILIYDVN